MAASFPCGDRVSNIPANLDSPSRPPRGAVRMPQEGRVEPQIGRDFRPFAVSASRPAVFQHGRPGRSCLPATAFLTHLGDTMTF